MIPGAASSVACQSYTSIQDAEWHVSRLTASCLMQSNADASLLSGAVNPTTIRQSILGFNGRNLLQDPNVKVAFHR